MTTTDHAAEAKKWLVAHFGSGDQALIPVGRGLIHAALAIAHEQRTANLIAAVTSGIVTTPQAYQEIVSRLNPGSES